MIEETNYKMCPEQKNHFDDFRELILLLNLPIEEYLRRVNLFENELRLHEE